MLNCIINCCKSKSTSKTNLLDLQQTSHELLKKTNKNLEYIIYKDTIPFILPIVYGKVIKVYDGDTITIAAQLPNITNNIKIYRFSVRLLGIDSPEIKGHTQNEKNAAIASREALHTLIFGKIIELRNNSNEKYGRILADVYLTNCTFGNESDTLLHVNKWMLDNKYAIPYNGGTKQQFNAI